MLKQVITRRFLSTNAILSSQLKKILPNCRFLHYNFKKCSVLTDDLLLPITYTNLQNYQKLLYRTAKKRTFTPSPKPLSFNYAGDLKTQSSLNPDALLYEYEGIKDLENAPPDVRKQFTVGYACGQDVKLHRIEKLLESFDKELHGDCNLEREIAKMTIRIRNQVPYILAHHRNKRQKHQLMVLIDKRRKMLRRLRSIDYERFLWLLKELQIKYIPVENPTEKQTRHNLLVQQAKDDALEMRNRKFDELKQRLEEEKREFLREKETVMQEIEKDIENLKLNKEDIFHHVDKLREERYNVKTENKNVDSLN